MYIYDLQLLHFVTLEVYLIYNAEKIKKVGVGAPERKLGVWWYNTE